MKKTLSRWLVDVWYKDPFIGVWLMPLGFLFSDAVKFRKFLYKIGVLKVHTLPVPVIVVGNITVGGTGKTPLIIWMAGFLKSAGYQPGIISRGYGGQAETWPQAVNSSSDPKLVGDEAVLMAKWAGCPVVVGPSRVESARLLLENNTCDVVLSDDGLQHYALNRILEIAVIDGDRRFGNGYCLPAGPLREPIERLKTVDLVIVNGDSTEDDEFSMAMQGDVLINAVTGEQKALADFKGIPCHALAGIGNPERFFKHLEGAGLACTTQSFPDHYQYQARDIKHKSNIPVLMTEKDAVKCTNFVQTQHWYLPIKACPEPRFAEHLLNLLKRKA
jgi:tetraacyldisaccharide 4'-kinase